MGIAEQKVKVPHVHCDSRVQTLCADVMNFPYNKLKALSPKVTSLIILSMSLTLNVVSNSRVQTLC